MKLFRALACSFVFSATSAVADEPAVPAPATTEAAETLEAAPVAATAAPTEAAPAAATAATPAAAAPVAATAPELGKPAAGKGQIVFFRPAKLTGALIGFKVREDKQELGVLKNGTYFVIDVVPGAHTYVVHSEAKDKLTLEVEEGEVYFVSGGITMGFMAGRPNLSPSEESAFEAVRAKLMVSSL